MLVEIVEMKKLISKQINQLTKNSIIMDTSFSNNSFAKSIGYSYMESKVNYLPFLAICTDSTLIGASRLLVQH